MTPAQRRAAGALLGLDPERLVGESVFRFLPDDDVERLSARLRRRLAGRAVPVVVVTVHDDPATEARCIELGAEDYLTKPIDRARLGTALMNVARTRALKQELGTLRDELRELIQQALREPYPKDYELLIREYFRALLEETRP